MFYKQQTRVSISGELTVFICSFINRFSSVKVLASVSTKKRSLKGPSPNIVPTSARTPDTSYTDRQLWCPRQSPFALCVTVVASMLWLVWLAVSSPISLIFIDEVICLGHFANTRPPLFTMLMLSSPNMYI